jgi:hypothetical protein
VVESAGSNYSFYAIVELGLDTLKPGWSQSRFYVWFSPKDLPIFGFLEYLYNFRATSFTPDVLNFVFTHDLVCKRARRRENTYDVAHLEVTRRTKVDFAGALDVQFCLLSSNAFPARPPSKS